MAFERIETEEVWNGRIASVRIERWRQEDGEVVEREVVGHPGAVCAVAHDGERLWLVRQPREPVGDPALLELPAGKLDTDGEDALQTMQRELREEIGKSARNWKHLTTFWSSPRTPPWRVRRAGSGTWSSCKTPTRATPRPPQRAPGP